MLINGTNLEEMEVRDLETAMSEIKQELKKRETVNCLYTSDCKDSSKYHRDKLKHWAKLVDGVDTTKTNGYAFLGEFLKITSEHILAKGSIVVEYCEKHGVKAYRIIGDDEKEELGRAQHNAMTALIRQIAEELNNI